MSSLKEKLLEDMKSAMRDKKNQRLSIIKKVRASIKNVEIEKRTELDDDAISKILAEEVKQRNDSTQEYKKAGNDKMVKQLSWEVKILNSYLSDGNSDNNIEKIN